MESEEAECAETAAVDLSRVYHITVSGGGAAADTAIPVPLASFFELRCQVKVSPVRLRKSSVRKMQSAERAGCWIGVHSAHHEMNGHLGPGGPGSRRVAAPATGGTSEGRAHPSRSSRSAVPPSSHSSPDGPSSDRRRRVTGARTALRRSRVPRRAAGPPVQSRVVARRARHGRQRVVSHGGSPVRTCAGHTIGSSPRPVAAAPPACRTEDRAARPPEIL